MYNYLRNKNLLHFNKDINMKNLQTMKHSVQKGFTLIELMIVVAIIGILAALAIPAYTDYTIRSKVGEAASLSGSAKTAVDIWYSEKGTLTDMPTTPASLGLSLASSYSAQYVSSVEVQNDGSITITLNTADQDNVNLPTGVGGNIVEYEPQTRGGTLYWSVCPNPADTNICPKGSASTVTQKYLPRD